MKNKLKGKSFQELKKRGNRHRGYPIKFHSSNIRKQGKKKYKDPVFTKLLNNKAAAIQLYNSLYHKNLPEDTPIEIVTLDDVLFTKEKNDVAFVRRETEERVRKEERAKADVRLKSERARTTIDTLLDVAYSNKEILATLQKKLEVTKQQAKKYLKKFYDDTLQSGKQIKVASGKQSFIMKKIEFLGK